MTHQIPIHQGQSNIGRVVCPFPNSHIFVKRVLVQLLVDCVRSISVQGCKENHMCLVVIHLSNDNLDFYITELLI
mgnify:FL=1